MAMNIKGLGAWVFLIALVTIVADVLINAFAVPTLVYFALGFILALTVIQSSEKDKVFLYGGIFLIISGLLGFGVAGIDLWLAKIFARFTYVLVPIVTIWGVNWFYKVLKN